MKQFQILIILLLLLVISIVYLFSTTDMIVVKNGVSEPKGEKSGLEIKEPEPVDLEKLEADYKSDVSVIFKEIESLFADSKADIKDMNLSEKADLIKDKLVKSIVPSDEYKKLHIDLVLLLTEINNYIINKTKDIEVNITNKMEEIRSDYEWIQ